MNEKIIETIPVLLAASILFRCVYLVTQKPKKDLALKLVKNLCAHMEQNYGVSTFFVSSEEDSSCPRYNFGTMSSCDEVLRYVRESFEHFGYYVEDAKEKKNKIYFSAHSSSHVCRIRFYHPGFIDENKKRLYVLSIH